MSRLVAITRSVGPSLADCELTFQAREPIYLAEAILQHAAYVDALRKAGVAVEVLSADKYLPDAVFGSTATSRHVAGLVYAGMVFYPTLPATVGTKKIIRNVMR